MKPEDAKRIKETDKRYVWHPFTPMKDWLDDDPVLIESGEGPWLVDVDGNRYLDGISSLWTNVHGHRHPVIDAAVRSQLDKIAHSTLLGFANVPSAVLAERLIGIAPRGLARVFYSDSGSEAVEIALKIAYQYWRQCDDPKPSKSGFVTFVNAYHGDTIGSVSVGGIELFHEIYRPLLFETYRAPAPYCYRCPLGMSHPGCSMACLDKLEEVLAGHSEEIVGVICEPLVQGAAGMITAPPGHLKRVRELCDAYDVLMIADEVAVGFGRTGKMFACEWEGVTPDLMALAKGISGGYLPLAATLANERVFEAFLTRHEDLRTFYHGHTYTGNQLACAAAMASLDVFERERTLENLPPKLERLAEGLERIAGLDIVGDVRRKGVLTGIEIVRDKESKEPFPVEEKKSINVCRRARKYGVIIRPLGEVVILNPPLCISEEQVDLLVEAVGNSIADLGGA